MKLLLFLVAVAISLDVGNFAPFSQCVEKRVTDVPAFDCLKKAMNNSADAFGNFVKLVCEYKLNQMEKNTKQYKKFLEAFGTAAKCYGCFFGSVFGGIELGETIAGVVTDVVDTTITVIGKELMHIGVSEKATDVVCVLLDPAKKDKMAKDIAEKYNPSQKTCIQELAAQANADDFNAEKCANAMEQASGDDTMQVCAKNIPKMSEAVQTGVGKLMRKCTADVLGNDQLKDILGFVGIVVNLVPHLLAGLIG